MDGTRETGVKFAEQNVAVGGFRSERRPLSQEEAPIIEAIFARSEVLGSVREILLVGRDEVLLFGGSVLLVTTPELKLGERNLVYDGHFVEKKMGDVDMGVENMGNVEELAAKLRERLGDRAEVVVVEREGILKRVDIVEERDGQKKHIASVVDVGVKDDYLQQVETKVFGFETSDGDRLGHSIVRGEVLANLCRYVSMGKSDTELVTYDVGQPDAEFALTRLNPGSLMTPEVAKILSESGDEVIAINVANSVVYQVGKAMQMTAMGFGIYDSEINRGLRESMVSVKKMIDDGIIASDRPRYIASKAIMKAMNSDLLYLRNSLVDLGLMQLISTKMDTELEKFVHDGSDEAIKKWRSMNDLLRAHEYSWESGNSEQIEIESVFGAMLATMVDSDRAQEIAEELVLNWRSDVPLDEELLWGGRRLGKTEMSVNGLMKQYNEFVLMAKK